MKSVPVMNWLAALTMLGQVQAGAADTDAKLRVRAVLDLNDGSRLVGSPVEKDLPVTLDFTKAAVAFEKIRSCEVRHKDGRVLINFENGDKLTGVLALDHFKLETMVGLLSPEIAKIDRMTFSTWREGNMPPGEGDISFGGVNWKAWKTQFEIQGDKLASLPKARPGFNYGHNGSGRGPTLMSNIGNSDWRDYRIECEFCVTGMDPSLNPYGVGSDFHDGSILFHVVDAKENWNECGGSLYTFNIRGDGSWSLSCTYNEYCAVPSGYANARRDGERKLSSGSGLKIDRQNGNKYRIEVRGQHIQIWVDGEQVADVTDDKMGQTIGGKTLDHGGVGIRAEYDAMFWVRNFSATAL